jgi:hypothetical protein
VTEIVKAVSLKSRRAFLIARLANSLLAKMRDLDLCSVSKSRRNVVSVRRSSSYGTALGGAFSLWGVLRLMHIIPLAEQFLKSVQQKKSRRDMASRGGPKGRMGT